MNDDKRSRQLMKAYERHIAASGLRSTPERLAIIEAISRQKGRFGIQALADTLATRNFSVSRATLYNTLAMLQEAGIVARRQAVGDTHETGAVWEVADDRHQVGITLVCTRCGRRRAARDPALARQVIAKRFASFVTTGVEICVSGLCSSCRRKP